MSMTTVDGHNYVVMSNLLLTNKDNDDDDHDFFQNLSLPNSFPALDRYQIILTGEWR